MAPPVTFTFGPNGAYFCHCQGITIHDNCSWGFRKTVTDHLATPYFVSLGPTDNEYCAFYERKDGKQWLSVNYPLTPYLKGMEEFFRKHIEQEPSLLGTAHIAFGPGDKIIAGTLKNLSNLNLAPPRVLDVILSRCVISKKEPSRTGFKYTFEPSGTVMPAHISIGIHGEWFIRWADGLCGWDLSPDPSADKHAHTNPSYPALRKLLGHETSKDASEQFRRSIKYMVFDLWGDSNWFCVLENGRRIEFCLPLKVARRIQPVLDNYLKENQSVTTTAPQALTEHMSSLVSPIDQWSNETPIEGTVIGANAQLDKRRSRLGGSNGLMEDVPPTYQEHRITSKQNRVGNDGFWKRLMRGMS